MTVTVLPAGLAPAEVDVDGYRVFAPSGRFVVHAAAPRARASGLTVAAQAGEPTATPGT